MRDSMVRCRRLCDNADYIVTVSPIVDSRYPRGVRWARTGSDRQQNQGRHHHQDSDPSAPSHLIFQLGRFEDIAWACSSRHCEPTWPRAIGGHHRMVTNPCQPSSISQVHSKHKSQPGPSSARSRSARLRVQHSGRHRVPVDARLSPSNAWRKSAHRWLTPIPARGRRRSDPQPAGNRSTARRPAPWRRRRGPRRGSGSGPFAVDQAAARRGRPRRCGPSWSPSL